MRIGVESDSKCGLYQSETESHDHLFFSCPYSSRVWRVLKNKCNVSWGDRPWNEWVVLCSKELKRKNLGNYIKKLCFNVSVYSLWNERNGRIFRKEFKPEEIVIQEITNLVRNRIVSMKNIKRSNEDQGIMGEWKLPDSILKQH